MNEREFIKENYIKVNQISVKCIRIVILMLICATAFSYVALNIDRAVIILSFTFCAFFALIPTLLVNIFRLAAYNFTKHIIILSTVIITTILLSVYSFYALPMLIFPILLASLYYNRTLVLYTSLYMSVGIVLAALSLVYFKDSIYMFQINDYVDSLLYYAVPNILIMFGMSTIAYFIVGRNSNMINTAIETAITMENNQKGLIYAFAEISESKSKFTGEHIKRVAAYMKVLGKASGFDDDYVDKLSTASMMHDIGKLMISEEILDKPDKLTDDEYQIMRNHVLYGDALLEKCPGKMMHLARILAKEHHERWDGTGYLGMKGEEIAYISRLVAVCDVFDALTSDRYYKKGWSLEDTYNEIIKLSNTHFDPQVVKLFAENFSKFKEVYNNIPDKQKY